MLEIRKRMKKKQRKQTMSNKNAKVSKTYRWERTNTIIKITKQCCKQARKRERDSPLISLLVFAFCQCVLLEFLLLEEFLK